MCFRLVWNETENSKKKFLLNYKLYVLEEFFTWLVFYKKLCVTISIGKAS